MTDVHETVQRLEQSAAFRSFTNANPHHYLVHVFTTVSGKAAPLELGYYGNDKITVFKTEPVAAMPPEDVFKEQGTLQKLDLGLVKLGLQEALERAEKERVINYPRHPTMKVICVLQQHNMPVWNLTLVTNTLQMINMKFSALTGELISRQIQSIMNLARE